MEDITDASTLAKLANKRYMRNKRKKKKRRQRAAKRHSAAEEAVACKLANRQRQDRSGVKSKLSYKVSRERFSQANFVINQIDPNELQPLQGHTHFASGKFGECSLRTYRRFDIVILEKQLKNSSVKDVIAEAQCMNAMTHKSIPQILGVQIKVRPYSLVMEFIGDDNMKSATVHNLLFESTSDQPTLCAREWISVCHDVSSAVQHIHGKGLLHCDLKVNNVLVAQKTGFVIDFGKCCHISKPSANKYTSFFPHIAPEVLLGKPVSTASDVFSLGVIIYTISKVLKNKLLYTISKRCKDASPLKRPSIAKILHELKQNNLE